MFRYVVSGVNSERASAISMRGVSWAAATDAISSRGITRRTNSAVAKRVAPATSGGSRSAIRAPSSTPTATIACAR